MKKKIFASVLLSLISVMAVVPAATAAPKTSGGGNTNQVGMDVSWPQCGKTLPTTPAFAVINLNGGTAAKPNPCLAAQLSWANGLSGAVASQNKVQVYVNTANPGELISEITTWPTASTASNPHGACNGANTIACSWQYGWNRAEYTVNYFKTEAPKAGLDSTPSLYKWWLDVETENTWQSGFAEAYKRNVAALEGWVAYFNGINARTGIYSTAYQWGQITSGQVSAASNLNGLHSWLAGSKTLNGAKSKCTSAPLTAGGKVVLSQYVSGGYDYNYSCI